MRGERTARACVYAPARARERACAGGPDGKGREAGKPKRPLVDGGCRGTRRAAKESGGMSARAGSNAAARERAGRCRAASPPRVPAASAPAPVRIEMSGSGRPRDRRTAPRPPPSRAAPQPRHARALLLGRRGRQRAVRRRRRRMPAVPAPLPRRPLRGLADRDSAGGAGGGGAASPAVRRDPPPAARLAPDRPPRRWRPIVALSPPPLRTEHARERAARRAVFFFGFSRAGRPRQVTAWR